MFRVYYEETVGNHTLKKSVVKDTRTPQAAADLVRGDVRERGNTCIVKKTKRVNGTRAYG